ncbi:MAG TPA: family 1 glycosylhydrolase, partial [Armatimonadota bacterium]|nr:family 1 glycosylhydrolase [Armatimonadota bacterium]
MSRIHYREPEPVEGDLASPSFQSNTRSSGTASVQPDLELWTGIECTVNRVQDEYFDQMERSGHIHRLQDLDLFAWLGVSAVRYPVLWERTAPQGLETADWSWADERLGRLRELGVRPIVGLVHHGSGPRHTSLVDPSFPEGLAEFAGGVARRFPWVESYTPVNEPLTTARFSGLYGHWYPHGRDPLTFSKALLNECRGTALAMRAIREVNPAAKLVQTDDLGRTHSTPALAYQAEFENERRWITWDLLCGKVDRHHPMWERLTLDGIPQAELEWFLENPCPPDIIGINHYPNSERWLDERMERYPEWSHGGNLKQAYADVEAVRVLADGLAGPRVLLREAWERYHIPIAVTEAHHGCTRDEQLRWVQEVWNTARELRREGVDLRAVTPWAVLGLYDWNQLCVRSAGHYEPGIFDIRGSQPRPTALAELMRDLAAGRKPEHPVLDVPGWWKRPDRIHYEPVYAEAAKPPAQARAEPESAPARPVVIAGARGALGQAFARLCEIRGLPYRLLSRKEMDIADPVSVRVMLEESQPWAVVNAAGYTRVDEAETAVHRCRRENTEGPAVLAAACARYGTRLLTFSSSHVFDGNRREPYVESDPVAPLNTYGRSKAEGEARVLQNFPGALVIRAGELFGPWDSRNFVALALRELSAGHPFT